MKTVSCCEYLLPYPEQWSTDESARTTLHHSWLIRPDIDKSDARQLLMGIKWIPIIMATL